MQRVIDLQEEVAAKFPQDHLLDTEILALRDSRKFDVEPASPLNGYMCSVRSHGWIGQIPIGDDLLVRVIPKVPVANIFRMLEVAYNLKSFRLFDGEVLVESLADVYERIVSILARRVLNRARKGLYRNYIEQTEELPYLRGQVDVVGAALNCALGIPLMPCHYEEHTADIEENRILLWTLHQVHRQALQHDKVRIELDRARRTLAGTITLDRHTASDCVNRIYNRLNDDYSPMHGLCRFILEHTGPGIKPDTRTFIPFELYMPQLFESFIAEWLRANEPQGMTVRCQHHAQLDANFEMKIRIDILLNDEVTQQPIAVLDTKYKASEHPSEADIYQIAFYAHELRVNRAFLVYPSTLASPVQVLHAKDVSIESLIFNIGTSPDVAGQAFLAQLTKSLASR